jgi:hypothetical protein
VTAAVCPSRSSSRIDRRIPTEADSYTLCAVGYEDGDDAVRPPDSVERSTLRPR